MESIERYHKRVCDGYSNGFERRCVGPLCRRYSDIFVSSIFLRSTTRSYSLELYRVVRSLYRVVRVGERKKKVKKKKMHAKLLLCDTADVVMTRYYHPFFDEDGRRRKFFSTFIR